MPSNSASATPMKASFAASGQCRAITASAFGPCKREQRAVVDGVQRHARRKMRAYMRIVLFLAAGVEHNAERGLRLEPARQARDHQIVDDAAVIVQQQRVALPPEAERTEIAGGQRLERVRHCLVVGAGEKPLPHMRDIEQARRRPACADALSECRSDIAPACRSRRTAPSWRRARRAALQRGF